MNSGPTKSVKGGTSAKTVMAPSKSKSVGAPVKKAVGSKTVKATSSHNTAQGSKMLRPGMTVANATSAKKVPAYKTMAQQAREDSSRKALATRRNGGMLSPSDGFRVRRDKLHNKPTKI